MLNTNLLAAAEPVNGCAGTVQDIVYSADKRPPALPEFVVCHFPGYRGQAFGTDANTVPIAPDGSDRSQNAHIFSYCSKYAIYEVSRVISCADFKFVLIFYVRSMCDLISGHRGYINGDTVTIRSNSILQLQA